MVLGGYGTGVDVLTRAQDIAAIADVDISHFEHHIQEHNIDDPYELNRDLLESALMDMSPDGDVENFEAGDILDGFRHGGPFNLHDYKEIVRENADELGYTLYPEDEITWENLNEATIKKNFQNARYILDTIKEINFIYHPWVTVDDIQRYRYYYYEAHEYKSAIQSIEDRENKKNLRLRRRFNEELLMRM